MVKVSIIIPTYNRQNKLQHLLKILEKQTLKDFEVIVVNDGGCIKLDSYIGKCPYKLQIMNIPNSGCNTARNKGIENAKASIIAFTDDDCIPDKKWLENGLKYFRNPKVVGVEGLIYSERKGDATHRTPQILERKGLIKGKTANMFYRKKILKKIGGFDRNFSVKISRGIIGYRGDTDLAWRVEKHGEIPFAKDVRVFHTVDKTSLKKELLNSIFFIFSSLLLKKHPDRFRDVIRLTLFPVTPSIFLKIFWLNAGLLKDIHIIKRPYMENNERNIIVDLIKNLKPKICLEWGSGFSTIYFTKFLHKDALWISMEHDKYWYEYIKNKIRKNVKLYYIPPNNFPWTDKNGDGSYNDLKDYVNFPKKMNKKFDFILIDGRARNPCLKLARELLKEKGIVILHDANRKYYHPSFDFYRFQLYFKNNFKVNGGVFIGSNSRNIENFIDIKKYIKKLGPKL